MQNPQEKLTKCVSNAELERRWTRVREMMGANEIDYLVLQNSEEFLGGALRWFTGHTARYQFPMTVIFPVDDEMTTINCGGDPPAEQWPPPWAARGIKNRLGAPYFSTIQYTNTYEAELAVGVLKEKKRAKIGLVERAFIPITFYEHLARNLPEATFVDATEWVDEIKVIKSPEEIELIKGTAALQDAAVEHLKKTLKPGMKDCDVLAELQYSTVKNGSECQLILVGSGPLGTAAYYGPPHFQNRTIMEGDQVSFVLETNGPGGYYTEILRIFMVGKEPSQELRDAFAVVVEAQELTASRLKADGDPKEIWDMNNEFLKKNGYPSTPRLFAHGQGTPLVERPLIRYNETWKLRAGMNIAVHPLVVTKDFFAVVGDNYIVGKDRAEPCLHKFPKEIVVV